MIARIGSPDYDLLLSPFSARLARVSFLSMAGFFPFITTRIPQPSLACLISFGGKSHLMTESQPVLMPSLLFETFTLSSTTLSHSVPRQTFDTCCLAQNSLLLLYPFTFQPSCHEWLSRSRTVVCNQRLFLYHLLL